jgi:chromosomal replication initiator protein
LTINQREVVAALSDAIAQRIGEPRYDFWFLNKTKFTWEGDKLVIGVPNLLYQEWLQNTFADPVAAAAKTVCGRQVPVKFSIDPELFRAAREAQSIAQGTAQGSTKGKELDRPTSAVTGRSARGRGDAPSFARGDPSKERRWRFLEHFVVGPCNRVAHASATSVVEAPGDGLNPLVLHGPVGTGKTHLLEGIYAGLRRKHPDWQIIYLTAEEFTNRFVHALRVGKLGSFRKQFRECDTLLLDDLQFLARKRATREEFVHTMDSLLSRERQVVISCDCHPRLAEDFAPELTDRLLAGSAWGLAPPELETRLGILRAKVAASIPPISEEVLRLIAEQLRGNVRELEGALNSIIHYGRVTGQPVDVFAARAALAELLRHAVRVVQLPDLDRAVCQVLRLQPGALQTKNRAWAVSHPRMLAMYLARKHTSAAYSEIGRYFGGRNHTTAVAAEKKARAWLQEEAQLCIGEQRWPARQVVELVERELFR